MTWAGDVNENRSEGPGPFTDGKVGLSAAADAVATRYLEDDMKFAIVYDSRTGRTKAAAEEMAEVVRRAGHDCTVESVQSADPTEVSRSDVICIGSWTEGLFIVLQHATKATMSFIEQLGPLDGKPAAVFCTYKTATGKMLPRMADALAARGGQVTGQFRSRGPHAAEGFAEWVTSVAGGSSG